MLEYQSSTTLNPLATMGMAILSVVLAAYGLCGSILGASVSGGR